jgi:hypothetical protein
MYFMGPQATAVFQSGWRTAIRPDMSLFAMVIKIVGNVHNETAGGEMHERG